MNLRAILAGACLVALGAGKLDGTNSGVAAPAQNNAPGGGWVRVPSHTPQVGDAVAVKLSGLDGKPVDTTALRGKMVLVDCWATSCGTSMGELPHLVALNQKYKDQGLVIVGVPLESNRDKLQSVMTDKGADWAETLDTPDNTIRAWAKMGVNGTATGVLISPEGKMLWRGITSGVDDPLAKAFVEHPPKVVASAKQASGDRADLFDEAAPDAKTDAAVTASDGGAQDPAKTNPVKAAPVEMSDEVKAKAALGLAQSYEHSGMSEKAKTKYQDIVNNYPTTPAAATAKEALEAMNKG
jgi:thiol-disulfide isomerase/thioredoxin